MDQERDIIIERVRRFLRDENFKMAILFGSYARGTQTRHSDVDLFIIDERFEGLSSLQRSRMFRPLLNVDFKWYSDIICLTPEEFEEDAGMGLAAHDAVEEGIIIVP